MNGRVQRETSTISMTAPNVWPFHQFQHLHSLCRPTWCPMELIDSRQLQSRLQKFIKGSATVFEQNFAFSAALSYVLGCWTQLWPENTPLPLRRASSLPKKLSLLSKYSFAISFYWFLQNIRNTLANPISSFSFKKVYYNIYNFKNPLGLLLYYSAILIYFLDNNIVWQRCN